MMHVTLLPSLPAADWGELEAALKALAGVVNEFQVDIVDGNFVHAISWPFTETDLESAFKQLAEYSETFDIEFDCMVTEPVQYLDRLVTVGAKRIIVHFGSTEDWRQVFDHHAKHGYALGLAFTNDIPLDEINTLLPHFDYVQVMGIAVVGAQGQPFDERTLETVSTLRASYPKLEIAIDGSVNEKTIPPLLAAGATRLAPGSAITKQPDPARAYKQLLNLLK